MRFEGLISRWRHLDRRRRRLAQAILVGVAVAGLISIMLWAGLLTSAQVTASDYLYDTGGDPGEDIVIIAIDENTQRALGGWPLPLGAYVRLFERLGGAGAVGFDVLLDEHDLAGNPQTPALLEAVRRAGNVAVPLSALEFIPPKSPGELYSVGDDVRTAAGLVEVAAGAGAVIQILDADGALRRAPLLVRADDETWEALGLRVLRVRLGLGHAPAQLSGRRVIIGDENEVKYEIPVDAHGCILVNYVGRPNTFPSVSFIDVIEGRVDPSAFGGKIVLVGMMNALAEMDLHKTPVSAARMAGVEFQANLIHTLLNHRALVPQSQGRTMLVVVLLSLASALVLSQFGAALGAVFSVLLAAVYLIWTSIQFNAGTLPNVLFVYVTIVVNYVAVAGVRFASERMERNRVTDVFGRFVPEEVRNQIVGMALQDPALIQPGGRQMEISVLFADIRGFTTMSENLEPAAVVDILNRYLDSMEAEVFEQGGTLDKYTGDGMMVLFGAPIEQPDHAERAVRAALGMQRAAAEVSRQRGEVKWGVRYGIGITTGQAVVGHIGSRRRLDYTAIGDTVNLAARLEGNAPPGAVYVSQETFERVKGLVVTRELPPMMVKNKAKPVTVYRVLGMRAGRAEQRPEAS